MSANDRFWAGLIHALVPWFALNPERYWAESGQDASMIGLIEQG